MGATIVPFEPRFLGECEALIATLPDWFGIPESTRRIFGTCPSCRLGQRCSSRRSRAPSRWSSTSGLPSKYTSWPCIPIIIGEASGARFLTMPRKRRGPGAVCGCTLKRSVLHIPIPSTHARAPFTPPWASCHSSRPRRCGARRIRRSCQSSGCDVQADQQMNDSAFIAKSSPQMLRSHSATLPISCGPVALPCPAGVGGWQGGGVRAAKSIQCFPATLG